MSVATEVRIRVGEKVLVEGARWPGIWTIVKINQVTVGLEQDGALGKKRRLRCAKEFLLSADGASSTDCGNGSVLHEVPFQARKLPFQDAGMVVRYIGRGGTGGLTTGMLMFVLIDKVEKVNVTLVGGNGGRYWRMPHRNLEAVDQTKVKVTVTA